MASGAYDPFRPKGQGSQDPTAPSGSGQDRFGVMKEELNGAIKAASHNVESVRDRGERLENLQDKSDGLQAAAQDFHGRAGRVRRQMWWKDMKMRIWIGVGIVVLLAIIIIPAVVTTRGN
jgi:vesicle-associated membrane protein 4